MLNLPFHIKDIHGYVFFSGNTTGKAGKPVKIHSSLFIDFFCAVDPSSHDGQTIIRDIESLRVLAKPNRIQPLPRPRNSDRSVQHYDRLERVRTINNVMAGRQECSLVTKNVRVYYRIHQKDGDACPTVYISDVQVIHSGQDQVGGLYDFRGRQLEKIDKPNLDGRQVVISGASDTVSEVMKAATWSLGRGTAVFFNPASVADDLSVARTKRLTQSTTRVVDELASVLIGNQKKSVAWLVEGEGAAVLSHAVKKVAGSLEKHSFRFSNAKANLPSLMQELSQRKAQLNGEFMAYESDKTALVAIAVHKQALLKQIDQLPSTTGYEKITRRYLLRDLESLGNNTCAQGVVAQPDALRASQATFVAALTSFARRFV